MKNVKILTIGLIITSISAFCQEPYLLKDINLVEKSSSPVNFIEYDNEIYFSAYSEGAGRSLWKTDGTADGTKMVINGKEHWDLCNPRNFFVFKGKLAFWSDEGVCITDGTAEGSSLIRSTSTDYPENEVLDSINGLMIFTGWYPSYLMVYDGTNNPSRLFSKDLTGPHNLRKFNNGDNGYLYMCANGLIWKTDGTEKGTLLINDDDNWRMENKSGKFIYLYSTKLKELWTLNTENDLLSKTYKFNYDDVPYSFWYNIMKSYPFKFAGKDYIILSAYDNNLNQLWISDGTTEGTKKILDQFGKEILSPEDIKVVNDYFYFTGLDSLGVRQLMISNGTTTSLIPSIKESYKDLTLLSAKDDKFYFTVEKENSKVELYYMGFGDASPTLLKNDMLAGPLGNPSILFNDNLLYAGKTIAVGEELWTSNENPASTNLIKNINPGGDGSTPKNLITHNNKVIFEASDGLRNQLWISDGKEENTVHFNDKYPYYTGSFITSYLNDEDGLYFTTTIPLSSKQSIWLLTNTDSLTHIYDTSYFGNIKAKIGNTLYFIYGELEILNLDNLYFKEIYRLTDGDTLIQPGNCESYFLNGQIILFSWSHSDIYGVYSYDGNYDGKITTLYEGSKFFDKGLVYNYIFEKRIIGNNLYFTAYTPEKGIELWKTDGTKVNTSLVKDMLEGAGNSCPGNLTEFNNKLYFICYVNGAYCLAESDGTTTGTKIVKSLHTSSDFSPFYYGIMKANNNNIFYCMVNGNLSNWNESSSAEIFIYGGVSMNDFDYIKPKEKNWLTINNFLIFNGNSGSGNELCASDGTPQKTYMIKNINIYGDSNPHDFTKTSDKIYFVVQDTTNNYDLWAMDIPITIIKDNILDVGVAEVESAKSIFSVYPNPVIDEVTVNILDNVGKYSLAIYNLLGEIIFSKSNILENIYKINISNFSPGIYIISYKNRNETKSTKIIKVQ